MRVEKPILRRFYVFLVTTSINLFLFCHVLSCLWIEVMEWNTVFDVQQYINAIYFVYVTAAGIGYGDITVDKETVDGFRSRMALAIILLLLG